MSTTADRTAPDAPTEHAGLHIDDLPIGSMRMMRVSDRRVCLIHTSTGVFALDHACPHEGYGLTQGELDGDLLTCAWHNWKFRVTDGSCVRGEEDVRTHHVRVGDDGALAIELHDPPPDELRPKLLDSLRRGIAHDYVGQVSRDVVRLLRADANPGELVWEAVAYGAPRAEFGWGHAIASATDSLAMIDLYDGDQRALPIVQAIAGIAENERDRPVNELPDPVAEVGPDAATEFRGLVEAERLEPAQALLRGAIQAGWDEERIRPWFTAVVSDHLLSYGHGAIYAQKAFQLLERVGWERADTVLPHLVPTIVWGTREDTLPYMRPFVKPMASIELDALATTDAADGWSDDGALRRAILDGGDRAAPLHAAVAALRAGAGVNGVLDIVSTSVAERMLRYDPAGEFDVHDDFSWLDITHGLTYANAARWHARHLPHHPDTVRLALWCVFLAHWTGRHEWHTSVSEPEHVDIGSDLRRAGESLQCQALDDANTTAFIVHAHAVKTTRAATEEAVRIGSSLPLEAAARFLTAPKLERFVGANVARSIDFVSGRTQRE